MTPDRTQAHDRVLALFVGIFHGVGQEFAQRRRTEAIFVHRRNDVLGRHVLAEVVELDLEVLLARLMRLVREVLLDDVVVLPVERGGRDGVDQLERVIDRKHFAAVGNGDPALSHDLLGDLSGQLLVLEDAQDVFIVAAHVEHGVDEHLHDLEHFAKVLEQFTYRTSHFEPLTSVWPTAYPESPDPRPTAYQLPTDLAAVIKFALLRENLVIAAKLGTVIDYHL